MSSLPSTIKGIGLYKTGDLNVIEELDNLPFPKQKEIEVLIKVTYSGVDYYDTYQRSGQVGNVLSTPALSVFSSLVQVLIDSFPMMLGGDAAGTIIALPTSQHVLADVEYRLRGFAVGDNVVGVSSPPAYLHLLHLMFEPS